MADNVPRYGFRPVKGKYSDYIHQAQTRVVATAYQAAPGAVNVDLNKGDPVAQIADGTVTLAAAGAAVYGIIIAVKPYWDGTRMQPTNKLPGGTAWGTVEARRSEVLVLPATVCQWEVDADENTTATTEAAYRAFIGSNADHVFAPDATAAKAYPKINVSEFLSGASATAGWRLVNISKRENQDFSGANVKLIVELNEGATQEAIFGATGI